MRPQSRFTFLVFNPGRQCVWFLFAVDCMVMPVLLRRRVMVQPDPDSDSTCLPFPSLLSCGVLWHTKTPGTAAPVFTHPAVTNPGVTAPFVRPIEVTDPKDELVQLMAKLDRGEMGLVQAADCIEAALTQRGFAYTMDIAPRMVAQRSEMASVGRLCTMRRVSNDPRHPRRRDFQS